MLIRHTTNGQIDTMFGNGAMPPLFANVATIAVQADGEILVGSGSTLEFTGAPGSLSGYNRDGSIEFFFGVQREIAGLVGPAAAVCRATPRSLPLGLSPAVCRCQATRQGSV